MKRTAITVLAVVAILVALLQKTSLAFINPDLTDFVWGLAAGLSFGAIIVWFSGAE